MAGRVAGKKPGKAAGSSAGTVAAGARAKPPLKTVAANTNASPATAKAMEIQPHTGLPRVGYSKKIIALVYDFDGTLSPRPMQEYSFLPQLGIDPKDFWAECTRVARERQADPLITYMHLMYKKAKEKGLVVDRAALVKQGASVELYPGVTEWFGAIGDYPVSSCATTSFRRD